jgi:hypothetical protein
MGLGSPAQDEGKENNGLLILGAGLIFTMTEPQSEPVTMKM